GNGERAAHKFVGLEIVFARPPGEVVHFKDQSLEVVLIGIVDYRNDQVAVGERHRHADVDGFSFDNLVAIHRYVDHRVVLDGEYDGLDKHRSVREHFAFAFVKLTFYLVPPQHEWCNVGLHEGSNMRCNTFRCHHSFGDHLAHAIHLHDFITAVHRYRGRNNGTCSYSSGLAVGNVFEQVLLRHASFGAGAGERVEF